VKVVVLEMSNKEENVDSDKNSLRLISQRHIQDIWDLLNKIVIEI